MTEREKAHATWIIALAIVILLLWWLWYRANNPASSTTAPVLSSPTGGSGQQTPVVLGLPAPLINLAFQTPTGAFTNQTTGYVPLFGFLGYGRQFY